jgi:glycosyltransferase involved in cell wall biosynthesis
MKIAYLSTFYPFRGGIAQFNAALYREFEKEHSIKAFTFKTQYPGILFPGKSQFVQDNDDSDKIDSVRVLNTLNPFTYMSTAKSIIDYKPDMCITKFWMPFFAPSLGYVYSRLRKKGIKTISILDNVIPHEHRPGDMALIKYFLKNTDFFIVMSDTVKNDLLSLKPDADFKFQIHPLYNHFGKSINKSDAQERLKIPKNKKVLLFFGFIRKYKGLDLLIEALKLLGNEYHLIICGEVYGSFDEYQTIIDKYRLNNQISLFNRYISDQEVSDFFCAADVCVLPYRSATQSGIVGISFHFDLPVIASNVGSLKEMITDNGAGLMIEKPEPELIKNAIEKYFNSNIDVFKNNIKQFKSVASWKTLADGILGMIKYI